MPDPRAVVPQRGRRALLRTVGWAQRHRPWRGRIPSARLRDVAVLDGRTLTAWGVVNGLPRGVRGGELLLQFTHDEGETRRVQLPDAHWRSRGAVFRCAVRLEGGDGLDLRQGRWTVGLVTGAEGAPVFPVLGSWDDDEQGPTLWNPRSGVTGLRYRPSTDRFGNLAIDVRRYAAHAEVDRVTVDAGGIEVQGRIVGAVSHDDWSAEGDVVLTELDGDLERVLAVAGEGERFSFTIPLDTALAPRPEMTWRADIRGAGSSLALKKVLTDLRHLGRVVTFEPAVLPGDATARPAYGEDGRLLVRIRQAQTAEASRA